MFRSDACEQAAKDAKIRAEKAEEEVADLVKKAQQLEVNTWIAQLLSGNQDSCSSTNAFFIINYVTLYQRNKIIESIFPLVSGVFQIIY